MPKIKFVTVTLALSGWLTQHIMRSPWASGESAAELRFSGCDTLLLMRHGMRWDHAHGAHAFYNTTDAPWDSPLDMQWVDANVNQCADQWRSWLGSYYNVATEVRWSTSPLLRAVQTADALASSLQPTTDSPLISIESCVTETMANMRSHVRRFNRHFSERHIRSSIVDPNVADRAIASPGDGGCHIVHDTVDSQRLKHCCVDSVGSDGVRATRSGGNCSTHERIQCFATCRPGGDESKGRHRVDLIVSHSGIIRSLCYELSANPWCMAKPLGYMETLELRRCKSHGWKFVARHMRPC